MQTWVDSAAAAVRAMLETHARGYTDPGNPKGCMIVLSAIIGPPESAPVRADLAAMRARYRTEAAPRRRDTYRPG